jgi:hypothetical protein
MLEAIWDSIGSAGLYVQRAIQNSTSDFLYPARMAIGYIAPAIETVTKFIK